MRYRDLVIQLGLNSRGRYDAQVLQSSQGRVSWELDFRCSPAELRHDLSALADAARQRRKGETGRHFMAEKRGTEVPLTSQSIGTQLFRALFSERGRPIFERELTSAQHDKQGLRLRLKIDLEQRDLLAVYNLPWELLYNPDTRKFLGLSDDVAIVRDLDVNRPDTAVKRPRRLRILAAMADPEKEISKRLDLKRELESLRRRVESSSVELVPLHNATRERLYQALSQSDFHVLHFMGHGVLLDGKGCIVLEKEGKEGWSEPVGGASLAQDLQSFRTLQMVVLNSCSTADADFASTSPFEGVATALILGGVPVVVGMRCSILDSASVSFSENFYRQLAAGDPIEVAMSKGRQAIFRLDDESFEWAKPILFNKGGEIWPPRVWSRIKKISIIAFPLLLLAVIAFFVRLPAVHNFLQLQLSSDGKMSRSLAADYWHGKFASCEGSSYAMVHFAPPGGAEHVSLVQFKGLYWRIEPVEVNEAARLDGVEFLARSTIRFSSLRSAEAPSTDWSAWASPQAQPFTPTVVISKVKGQWLVATRSPHGAEAASSAEAAVLLPFDCQWLQRGKLDAGKLKGIRATIAADIQKDEHGRAETKILTGSAWAPQDPDLLLLFATLRLAQAKKEPVLERRSALRHEAYRTWLMATKISAARRPDGARLLEELDIMETFRGVLCSDARKDAAKTREKPPSLLVAPQISQLTRFMLEAGGCD